MSYRNNLQKGDRVMHGESKRVGEVVMQPRETSRSVSVRWQGNASARYEDVLDLRMIVDGKPEEVPPCDGTPPESKPEESKVSPIGREDGTAMATAALQKQRDSVSEEMARMNVRYKTLQNDLSKLERAIEVLTLPARPS